MTTPTRACTACGEVLPRTFFRAYQLSNGRGDWWRYVCPLCRAWLDVPIRVPEWPSWRRRDAQRVGGVLVLESEARYWRRRRAEREREEVLV